MAGIPASVMEEEKTMDKKMTIAEKLHSHKIRKPPALLYLLLANIWKLLFEKRLGITYTYHTDPRTYDGPYIVVSNHASRVDYVYTGLPFLPHRLNYVAGYNEFFRSHLALVFRLLQVIPKKNFVPDLYCMREIRRILKNGGRVCIFPEGMSSISGANQPVALGSGKFLKNCGVPVFVTRIAGGYLTNTKYCLDERKGKVHIDIDLLFTPEQLEKLSAEEITEILHEAIKHDDYAWNKKARVAFDGHGEMAKNLQDLLYWCPRCGQEMVMQGIGNNTFEPTRTLTVAEALHMAACLESRAIQDDFHLQSTSGAVWYSASVAYCEAVGILSSGQFSQF